jgi:hypothetical protein
MTGTNQRLDPTLTASFRNHMSPSVTQRPRVACIPRCALVRTERSASGPWRRDRGSPAPHVRGDGDARHDARARPKQVGPSIWQAACSYVCSRSSRVSQAHREKLRMEREGQDMERSDELGGGQGGTGEGGHGGTQGDQGGGDQGGTQGAGLGGGAQPERHGSTAGVSFRGRPRPISGGQDSDI